MKPTFRLLSSTALSRALLGLLVLCGLAVWGGPGAAGGSNVTVPSFTGYRPWNTADIPLFKQGIYPKSFNVSYDRRWRELVAPETDLDNPDAPAVALATAWPASLDIRQRRPRLSDDLLPILSTPYRPQAARAPPLV